MLLLFFKNESEDSVILITSTKDEKKQWIGYLNESIAQEKLREQRAHIRLS